MMHIDKINKSAKNRRWIQSGYTLIELAAAIIIIGLLIESFSPLYQVYLQQKAIKTTQLNTALVNSALGDFRAVYGRYPCPASLIADRNDPAYGFENCSVADTVAAGTCDPAGTGICLQNGQRDVTLPNGTTLYKTAMPQGKAQVGALPFRQLGLLEDQSIDGWHNKFRYVVSSNQMRPDDFAPDRGIIDVRNGLNTSKSLLTPDGSADYVLISHGPDGIGAYTQNGVQHTACPTSADPQNRNCTVGVDAVYNNAPRSTSGSSNSASHFDDFVTYFSRGDLSPWQMSDTNSNIYYVSRNNPVSPTLGVNINPGQSTDPNLSAQINGHMRARAAIKSSEYCAEDGTNCTHAENLGGDLTDPNNDMVCPNKYYTILGSVPPQIDPSYKYMTGIKGNRATCSNEYVAGCDNPNSQITGFRANGRAICIDNFCRARSQVVCDPTSPVNRQLPVGQFGNTATLSGPASGNLTEKWVCDSVTKDWQYVVGSRIGNCTCTAKNDMNRLANCPVYTTGQPYNQTSHWICPDNAWSPYTPATPPPGQCACVGGWRYQDNCPLWRGGGWTGHTPQKQQITCTNGKTNYNHPWEPNGPDTCRCDDITKSTHTNCPAGQSGAGIDTTQQWSCQTNTYSAPVVTKNCSCTNQTRNTKFYCTDFNYTDAQGLLHEYTGNYYQDEVLDCASGAWKKTGVPNKTGCSLKPPKTCIWNPQGTSTTANFASGPAARSVCSCGARGVCYTNQGNNTYSNYGSCQCN